MRDARDVASPPSHNDGVSIAMNGTNLDRPTAARNDLVEAQRGHMRAVAGAIAAGVPLIEIEHALGEFHAASGHLLRICGTPDCGDAPMVLV